MGLAKDLRQHKIERVTLSGFICTCGEECQDMDLDRHRFEVASRAAEMGDPEAGAVMLDMASKAVRPQSRYVGSWKEASVFLLLGTAFIAMKLLGWIRWSWLWVLAPLWMPPLIVFSLPLLLLLFSSLYRHKDG